MALLKDMSGRLDRLEREAVQEFGYGEYAPMPFSLRTWGPRPVPAKRPKRSFAPQIIRLTNSLTIYDHYGYLTILTDPVNDHWSMTLMGDVSQEFVDHIERLLCTKGEWSSAKAGWNSTLAHRAKWSGYHRIAGIGERHELGNRKLSKREDAPEARECKYGRDERTGKCRQKPKSPSASKKQPAQETMSFGK